MPPKRPPRRHSATTSDPRELYELSVQEPQREVAFLDRIFRSRVGRRPRTLREDFCGSAAVSAAWVGRRAENRATAVDRDGAVLEWARLHHLAPMPESKRRRLHLVQGDVRATRSAPVDVLLALNFSYSVFKERKELVGYLRASRGRLAPRGLMMVDAYGGSEAHLEIEEPRHMMGYTYVWEQAKVNPVNGHVTNHIHFRFPDGTELRRAFTYDWRLWSIPELRDAFADAGFSRTTVYWEGTNAREGTGNGRFHPTERGEACEGWVAYIVAER